MQDTKGHWGKELAALWTNYLPPCRVSWSELGIYSHYLKWLRQQYQGEILNLLILGSTSEFRDWGHEEFLNVTVIDFSEGYNQEIKKQMKYKNIKERFIHQRWQDMNFDNEFHLIVGDLAIGNLKRDEVPPFLTRIRKSLKNPGLFITKSFFSNENYQIRELEEIFKEYNEQFAYLHPCPKLIYSIAMSCLDHESGMLRFKFMYDQVHKIYEKGIISYDTFSKFENLGWQENMKFEFFMPTVTEWEKMIAEAQLNILASEQSEDIYSADFSIYVISIKQ